MFRRSASTRVVYSNEEAKLRALLATALEHGHGVVGVLWPLDRLQEALARGESGAALDARVYSTKRACPSCGTSFPEPDPRLFSYNSKHGWCSACFGTGVKLQGFDEQQTGEEVWWNAWYEGEATPCPGCHGQRLNPTALAVQWQGRSIAQLAAGSVQDARKLFGGLRLEGRDEQIARDVLAEIGARLDFLEQVGLGYLALDRAPESQVYSGQQRIWFSMSLHCGWRSW